MAIGRIAHYAFDAVLLSTVLAGVRRSSGFTPSTDSLDPSMKSFADRYLGVGESIFDVLQGTVVNSQYFKKEERKGSKW